MFTLGPSRRIEKEGPPIEQRQKSQRTMDWGDPLFAQDWGWSRNTS